jgi:cell division protein DivIC
MERQQKRKKRLYRRLALFAVLIICVFGYFVKYHLEQRSLYEKKVNQYEHLQRNMDRLQEEEKELQQEITLLNDTDYILQIARKDYFLSKEGEIIFKLPDDEASY